MSRNQRAPSGLSVPGWAWLIPLAAVPVVLLNGAVSWLGDTRVSPLSVSFLETKARAVGAYVAHQPTCLLDGHTPLEPLVDAAERKHRIPTGLLRALVEVESEARVHRISPAGAMGPGQLMPSTAQMLKVEDPFDSTPAVDASARYLSEQLRRFRGDVKLAVAAYNAGPGAVNGKVPRNGETEFYVEKVLKAYARLRPPPPPLPRPTVAKSRPPTNSTGKTVVTKRPTVPSVRPSAKATKPQGQGRSPAPAAHHAPK